MIVSKGNFSKELVHILVPECWAFSQDKPRNLVRAYYVHRGGGFSVCFYITVLLVFGGGNSSF